MSTITKTKSRKNKQEQPYRQIHVDPALHATIRQQAKACGLTIGGFVGWAFRTWNVADQDLRAKSLSSK